ncbi:MAG: carbonic anhydrase, partial [Gammaproteobacteria bacterium]|nr:carbonic anhydrase [Gammaproteobacteria bacterium]
LKLGLIDNWLRHVQDVGHKHRVSLGGLGSREERLGRLCELNVIEQVVNVAQTTVVQDAWGRGQELTVHGWIYSLQDGLVRDLGMSVEAAADLESCYEAAASPEALDAIAAALGGRGLTF